MTKQYIEIDEVGSKFYYKDKKMTKLHREDGPAVEYASGDKLWYINDKCHREDGPAIERANGNKVWYINDEIHREDGPAIENASGTRAWFVNNVCLTEKEFNARNAPVELTLEDIAAKFNIDVSKLKIVK